MSTFRSDSKEDPANSFRIDASDLLAVSKIKNSLLTLLEYNYHPEKKQLIALCIGTDRSTGDSLGPLVGTKLKQLRPRQCHIYGTLDEPVHAVNLQETIDQIRTNYTSPYIIAIDACLGRAESVGCVDIGSGPAWPGAGISKNLPPVGDIYINGIVNVGGFLEYLVLQNTRLNIVFRLAETITKGLYLTLHDKQISGAKNHQNELSPTELIV